MLAEQREYQPRKHGDMLLSMVQSVLDEAKARPTQLDGIAVAHGPGAFTGIRIGVAMAQGLGFGWGVPCIPVSTLSLWAASAFDACAHWQEVICLMDARMGEVYYGHFARQMDPASDHAVLHSGCLPPMEIQIETGTNVIGLVGSGVLPYQDILEQQASKIRSVEQLELSISFSSYGRLADGLFRAGKAVSATELDALYFRSAVSS